MEGTQVSEIRIHMPAEKKTCGICFDTDFNAEQMFCVTSCGHEFCVECVKRHIEVRVFEGDVHIRCPCYYYCKSKLTFESCVHLLTPKLRAIWKQSLEEEWSVPAIERVYCPNPKCSTLMLKTRLSKQEDGSMRCCFKCWEPFCIDCKAPWHKNLSCEDYKRLCPILTVDVVLNVVANQRNWRQCNNCKHLIERSGGCNRVTCRCGFSFCYTCGNHRCVCSPEDPATALWCCLGFVLYLLACTYLILSTEL